MKQFNENWDGVKRSANLPEANYSKYGVGVRDDIKQSKKYKAMLRDAIAKSVQKEKLEKRGHGTYDDYQKAMKIEGEAWRALQAFVKTETDKNPIQQEINKFQKSTLSSLSEAAKSFDQFMAKRIINKHTLQVGDILVTSWGYSMTLVHFFKVRKFLTPTKIVIASIGERAVTGSLGYNGTKVPEPSQVGREQIVFARNNGCIVTLDSGVKQGANLWDGKPEPFNHMD